MNTTTPLTSRSLNDANVAATQRAVSQTLGGLLSPLDSRLAKAFQAHRDHPLLRPFCNIFERHLKIELDQQSFIWSDTLRLNTRVVQAIDAAPISEDEKNRATFWLVLFHTSYFALGYQTRYLKAAPDQRTMLNLAFTQAVAHHMRSLGVKQPANSPHWEQHGYVFKPLAALPAGPKIAEEALTLLEQGVLQSADLTGTPLLELTDLNGRVANLQDFSPQVHETFAQEMINDWVAEFMKTNDFGSEGMNGIRLLYFKANPPRDASEAIMDCLRSKYPVADDLALYHNKKLANDYFAPKKADPIEEKTGHIELFIDCSGSISAGDIGDCMKVFHDFFAKRKKKMTYGISCFDTAILSRIEVTEEGIRSRTSMSSRSSVEAARISAASPRTSRKCCPSVARLRAETAATDATSLSSSPIWRDHSPTPSRPTSCGLPRPSSATWARSPASPFLGTVIYL